MCVPAPNSPPAQPRGEKVAVSDTDRSLELLETSFALLAPRGDELVERFYSKVARRRPLAEIDRLIDLSALERDLGWTPKQRLRVALQD